MMRFHTTPTFQVEYGKTISWELNSKIVDVFSNAESGYVNEEETELEMDFVELEQIIAETEDSELKAALQTIYDDCDKRNSYVHIELF